MKILWITNILFPDVCESLNIQASVVGGWMLASAKELIKISDVYLGIATVYNGEFLKIIVKDKITYYLIPSKKKNTKYNKALEPYWRQVKYEFQPDIVHIHGTEYAHGLAYIRGCGSERVVVSIQGLVSVIAYYYRAGISAIDILKNMTFRDLVRGSILKQQRDFYRQGKIEQEYIRSLSHVIGRTSWDRAHVLAINSSIHYHFCNETLREEFYKHTWKYLNCEKHTIFLSQAGYPVKGVHQVIKALPYVLKEYPDTMVYIAGENITRSESLSERLKISGYGRYIRVLIRKYALTDKIIFTGFLNEEQICARYLSANVFICPSSIENSPNSLGEAQLLGVPCIASYVGGIPDMMPNKQCGSVYRFDEVEMLAAEICTVFKQRDWDNSPMQEIARKRHDAQVNCNQMIGIYRAII